MEAAYVFGHVGNLAGRLGAGWSVEDHYAWTIGVESRLSLPLPGDDAAYTVRFTLHPLVYPEVRPSQRLTVLAGEQELASVTLTERGGLDVALPPALTRAQRNIELILRHPDGIRPSDVRPIDDQRLLSVCFHAALVLRSPGTIAAAEGRMVRSVIAGNYTALQLSRILQRLPALRGRLSVLYLDLGQSIESPETLQALAGTQLCWMQSEGGRDGVRATISSTLPPDCEVLRFPAPRCDALWPFQGPDPRAVPEPPRYPLGRYPFTDRIAARLAKFNLSDEVMQVIYDRMVETAMPDLNAALDCDIAAWLAQDAHCEIRLADRLTSQFRGQRLFVCPTIPSGALLREMALRLLGAPTVRQMLDFAPVTASIDRLMEGYLGQREELPIHPLVARHFRLDWWREDMTYRWHSNPVSFRDYLLDYIRWAPWRP